MNQKDKLGVLTGVNQTNNNGSALLRQYEVTVSRMLLGNSSDRQVQRTQPTSKSRVLGDIKMNGESFFLFRRSSSLGRGENQVFTVKVSTVLIVVKLNTFFFY